MADQLVAKNTGAPMVPEGEYQAVCADIIDLGMVENKQYGVLQHKVALVFQLMDGQSKRYEIAERFTLSMNEKARLRKFLEQWRGRPYKAEVIEEGVPLHKLEGQNGIVVVVHNAVGEKIYANVFSIRPLGKNEKAITPEKYTRAEYWNHKTAKAPAASPDDPGPEYSGEEDDDLPF